MAVSRKANGGEAIRTSLPPLKGEGDRPQAVERFLPRGGDPSVIRLVGDAGCQLPHAHRFAAGPLARTVPLSGEPAAAALAGDQPAGGG